MPIGGVRAGYLSTGKDAIPDTSVLHWPMDAASGTTITDDIGTNDGTLNGGTWDADSNYVGGQRIQLDGTDDYIVADNNASTITNASDWSVGITVQSDTSLSGQQMVWSWSDGTVAFGVYHVNGNFVASYYDGNNYSDYASHSEPSAPYRIRLFTTFDSSTGTLELYLNDSSSTGGGSLSLLILSSNLVVGSQQDMTDRYLNAYVDDFITMSEIEDATEDYNRQPWS